MKTITSLHSAMRRKRCAALSAWVLLAACAGDAPRTAAASPPVRFAAAVPRPPAGAPVCAHGDFQASALARINQLRARGAVCGSRGRFAPAGPLAWNKRLTQAAAVHSRDMAAHDYFAHDSRDGRTQRQRIDAAGYAWRSIAENIEAGSATVTEAIDSWMASDPHCANIMEPGFTEVGVACALPSGRSTYETYWTMELGRPR